MSDHDFDRRDFLKVSGAAALTAGLVVCAPSSAQEKPAADTATGVTLPAQQLIGFARVDLEPGASKTVSFVVPMSLLAYTGLSGDLVMEPGPVEVSAGSSSSDIRSSAKFTVAGKTRPIRGEDRAFLSVATVGS